MTLNSSLMHKKHQPILDLSGNLMTMCHFGPTGSAFYYLTKASHCVPFPDGTRGVLYYHVDPALPPISGSLRFRLCDELEGFELGSDLQVRPGQPWSISLCRLVRTQYNQPICNMLLSDGLINQRLVTAVQGLSLGPHLRDNNVIYDLQQPVIVSLHQQKLNRLLVTSQSCSMVEFCQLFHDHGLGRDPLQGNIFSARLMSPLF